MVRTQETEETENTVGSIVEKFKDERLFGVVEFHYMDGHVVRIKKIQSYEPKEFDLLIAK